MEWNPVEERDPIYDDLGVGQSNEMSSISLYDLALLLDDDDSLGSSSTRFQALAEDDDHLLDFSLLCGSFEPIQSLEPRQLVEESCFEGVFFPALPLNDSNESSFDTKPERIPPKSSRRALCDPCMCEALLIKLMVGFQEAGRLGPIENARRYAANLKKHVESGYPPETLRQPINISRQNVWLVDNLFDANGGFLYCSQVIRKIFHLGSHRLSRLHLLVGTESPPKASLPEGMLLKLDIPSTSQQLTVKHILTHKLIHLVVLPEEIKWRSDFKQVQTWLKTQSPTQMVLVRRILLAAPLQPLKLSNRALDDTKNLLVKMVQFGSIPTGKSTVSQGIKFYMHQGIHTICSPKKLTGGLQVRLFERDRPTGNKPALKIFLRNLAAWGLYDKKLAASLHGQFNMALASFCDFSPVVSDTVRRWVLEFLPDYALQPVSHPGVCEICEIYNFIIRGLTNKSNRAVADESGLVQNIIAGIQAARLKHLNSADSFADCLETHFLQRSADPTQPTSSCPSGHLGQKFPFSMCAKYLPIINLPQFGTNSHPESVFEAKSAVDTLACVAHNGSSLETVMILTCNEATGARSINHFLSSLNHYIQQYVDPSYLSFELYLDDVGSFKSWHVLAFLHHLVEIGRFKKTNLFYYPAGHCQSFSDSIFPQMPSRLRHQDIFNVEELQSAWSKEVGISQAVVLDGREIVMWDSYLPMAYHAFCSMDEFASFQFEESNGQIIFQVSPLPIATRRASLISQPSIRKSGVPLPSFHTLQETHGQPNGQPHDDGKKLESIASLYKRFVSDPSRWPPFIRRYVDHPQEHQDARPTCSSTATLDRFTSPLELHQSDDACDWLLSHVRCILTQQQQDDPDLVSRTYIRLFKHPDFIEALTEVSNPFLQDDSSSSAHAEHFPSFDTAPTLRPPLYLDNNIFPPSLFQMFGSSSPDGYILPQPTSPTELSFEFEPQSGKRSLADASFGEMGGWESVDALSLLRRRMD